VREDLLHLQAALLEFRLAELEPERPGVEDLYFIGVAPYALQDTFVRELGVVKRLMDERFDTALGKIFRKGVVIRPPDADLPQAEAGAPPAAPLTGGESVEALSTLARQHYERAIEAQRAGDWARYGEEIKQLGTVLEQMAKTPAAEPAAAPVKK